MSPYYSTLHTKFERNSPEIRVPETRQIFFVFFFFVSNNKRVRKLCSCASISTKFGAQVVLPKSYISTKFGTICNKNGGKYNQFVDTPTRKTLGSVILKFLLVTNLTLKVDCFDGFVNRSSIADFMTMKTNRCSFDEFLTRRASACGRRAPGL